MSQVHVDEAHPVEEGRTWRASATITSQQDEKWSYGVASTKKMDTQQDAALKVLQQLQSVLAILNGAKKWWKRQTTGKNKLLQCLQVRFFNAFVRKNTNDF